MLAERRGLQQYNQSGFVLRTQTLSLWFYALAYPEAIFTKKGQMFILSWTATNFLLPTTPTGQILIQLAASRGLESVCLVNNEEEAALALRHGAWKATLLKEVRGLTIDFSRRVSHPDTNSTWYVCDFLSVILCLVQPIWRYLSVR